ncbi:hypothetical protein [Halomonas sp. BC04]|uniref:hypothetical protein n=1 Tax=Halomonas sp. BC04 TaxID=1403540 RepID=UPI0012DFB92F|nr:hypothetical protein [Halomonas sp. BC04]
MSFDNYSMANLYTDLEIASGIPGLVSGKCDDEGLSEEEVDHQEELSPAQQVRLGKIIKIGGGNPDFESFRSCAIKFILEENVGAIIRRFSKKEGLPDAYSELVLKSDCLSVLIKGMLGKVARIPLSSEVVKSIDFASGWALDSPLPQTPYQRVSGLQRFIWDKVDQSFGKGAAQKLPTKHMRNLLSAARLHISIADILNKDAVYVRDVMRMCAQDAEEEERYAEHGMSAGLVFKSGKNFYPKWKVRHLRHVAYYAPSIVRSAVSKIENFDICLIGEGEARESIVREYIFC